jgi:hypothetical protein
MRPVIHRKVTTPMRARSHPFALTVLLATSALLTVAPPTNQAPAQPAPAPPGAPTSDTQPTADPPARVGRLALVTGTVSFHTAVDTDWSPATLNYPVSAGNSFWTQPDAEADLELGGTRIAMAPSTEVDLNTLDDTGTNATLPQGETYINVRALQPNEMVTLQTPRGVVTIAAPGQYDVIAGDTTNPTVVTAMTGAAQIAGTGFTLSVNPNQAATITGADTFQGSVGPATQDAFVVAMLARDRPPPPPPNSAPPPPVIAQLPGGGDLAAVGSWATAPTYGQVWYPPVAAGWAPYRNGRWAYVVPWGWTWVDDAPWGFAPFHYGRWSYIGNRWGWIPGIQVGVVAAPVYAPALVTFFGVAAAGVGVAIGGSIGWCPLGPNEVYHPWYHASPQYVRNVNVRNVTNVTNITTINNTTINNYSNARYATVAPATALTQSRPVAGEARPVSPQQLAAARPIVATQPAPPTVATAGVTPGVARQLHIAPAPGAPAPRVAPGPAVRPITPAATGRTATVPLRPATASAAAHPGTPVAHPTETPNAPAPATPGHPTPAVAQPGTAAHPAEPTMHPGQPAPPAAGTPAAARPGQPVEHPAETPKGPAPAPAAHPTPAAAQPGSAVHPTEPPAHQAPAVAHPAPAAHPTEPAVHPAAAPPPAAHPPPQAHPEEKKPEEKKPGQP